MLVPDIHVQVFGSGAEELEDTDDEKLEEEDDEDEDEEDVDDDTDDETDELLSDETLDEDELVMTIHPPS